MIYLYLLFIYDLIMENNYYSIVVIFFGLSLFKHILFGSRKNFNDVIFGYIQFIVFNNYLHLNSTKTINLIFDIIFWALFGLSPHNNSNESIEDIYESMYGKNNQEIINGTSNRRLLSEDKNAKELIKWIDEQKFLISTAILFTIIILTFVIGWVVELFCSKNKKPTKDTIIMGDGTVYSMGKVKWVNSYISILLRILLVCYCNMSTMTISQIMKINVESLAMGFISLCMLIFLVIGFPIFIIRLLYHNKGELYQQEFMDKYGSLYLNFKHQSKYNKFMAVILGKQFLYAIIINISPKLNNIQNSLLLFVNIVFIIFLVIYKPYTKGVFQLQAIIMSLSMIIITILNYIFIANDISGKMMNIFIMTSVSVYIITFMLFFIIQIYSYIKEKREPDTNILRLANNNIDTEKIINHSRNRKYKTEKSVTFTEEIKLNKSDLN